MFCRHDVAGWCRDDVTAWRAIYTSGGSGGGVEGMGGGWLIIDDLPSLDGSGLSLGNPFIPRISRSRIFHI